MATTKDYKEFVLSQLSILDDIKIRPKHWEESKQREALLEAKESIHKERVEYEREVKERRSELQKQERRLQSKEENLDKKTDALEKKNEQLTKKIMIGHMSAIESTLRVLDYSKFSGLADLIFEAKRIVWFGIGNAIDVAAVSSKSLCRLGIDSVVINDRAIMRSYAKFLKQGDIAIAVTRTGKTAKTLEALRTAKASGATTVLITNLVNSPGEPFADYFVCASRQDELYRICGYETCTSICALLETLVTLIIKKRGFDSKAQFLETMTSNK